MQPVRHGRTVPNRPRRAALAAVAALVLVPLTGCGDESPAARPSGKASASPRPAPGAADRDEQFAALERKFDARLGVYAVDTGSGREVTRNADARFSFNSTFKALLAGAILDKHGPASGNPEGMDTVLRYEKSDLVANSPVSEKHVKTGMSLDALCDAAVRYSDNTAANVLLEDLGGPAGFGAYLREETGDRTTRAERIEPDLSRWVPGELHDTTTPRRLALNLRELVLGDALETEEREQLEHWMRTNTTGDAAIRAGVPDDWKVGDKTGTGIHHGARDDIAVVRPPGRAPLVVVVMSYREEKDAEPDDRLIAETASVVAKALG